MKQSLFIVDGSSYIFRAYYAIKPLNTSKGLPTNAIIGFAKMILRLINTKKPEHIVVVFDSKEKNFRHELYPAYKANRETPPDDLKIQIPYIHQVVKALNINMAILPGFEADDIIGTIAVKEKDNFAVTIVSADKDLMQLVTDDIKMFDPMKDKIYSPKDVIEKMGVPPEQIIDFLAITGDSSDNIPGVAGLGPKGATELLKEFSTLENIYNNLDKIKESKRVKLETSRENAFLSQKLTALKLDVPFKYNENEFHVKPVIKEEALPLLTELELNSLIQDLNLNKQSPQEKPAETALSSCEIVLEQQQLDNIFKQYAHAKFIAIDTETTSENAMTAKIVGLSFAFDEKKSYYVPLFHNYIGVPDQLSLESTQKFLNHFLESSECLKIFHNLKYDLIVLTEHGFNHTCSPCFDTMIASYILHSQAESLSLKHLVQIFLGITTPTFKDTMSSLPADSTIAELEIEKTATYAGNDALFTLKLYNLFILDLEKHPSKNIFYDIEMPLVKVLVDMEMNGVSIDKLLLNNLSKQYSLELVDIEKNIYAAAGEEFNINSPKQLQKILFEKLGLKPTSKTKTGFSTNVEVLEKLAHKHPVALQILTFRELTKLKNTYIDTLPLLINKKTNKIHSSFNQTITSTGRLSSSNPNMQNIPIKTERGEQIRKAFVASSNNFSIVSADYSQIELRIMAHMANDQAFIDDFNKGKDIHTQTASRVFNINPTEVTPELRRRAKAVNFGLIYGMGAFALSEDLGISVGEAKSIIDTYFEKYSSVKKYMDQTIKFAQTNGYVSTLLGRRRYFPSINDKNGMVRKNSERAAINAPIQGTSADIIKLAMIKILLDINQFNASMILQVHDELVFEVPDENLKIFISYAKNIMENAVALKIPLSVNIAHGKNWFEAH